MTKIRILDDATINKIAAGEVIENPASVVKELIENAIDAGATEIHIETKAGGRGLIKVVDNGCGMSRDDLLLSLERHATSKIKEVEELNSLKTLGFRGEALPSIASVSRMQLHSAPSSGEGNLLEIEGGRLGKITPCPRRQGTTIEVNSLFFNVPVRKKFQKSLGWDTGEISKTLTLCALCNPTLSLSWTNDLKKQFSFLAGNGLDERLKVLMGDSFHEQVFCVEHERGNLHLQGKISTPAFHRPNRTGQFLFINGRSVVSPFIARKVLESYGTRLPTHRYPLFVLHLSMPPSWFDVNVHPQKKEVRLREEERLGSFLADALHNALEKREGVSNSTPIPHSPISFPKMEETPLKTASFVCEPVIDYQITENYLLPPEREIIAKKHPYFFVQEVDGIRVVHGLRAMERVIYEELNEKKEKPAIQTLLLPLQLTVTGKDGYFLSEHLEKLNARGIGIRHFGGNTYVVDAIPAMLEASEVQDLIIAYIEAGELPRDLGKCLKRASISLEAAKALVDKLLRCKNPDFTPNGKRIHYLLDEPELKKIFSA